MKRYIVLFLSLLMITACSSGPKAQPTEPGDPAEQEAAVRVVVEEFGKKLQMVSLLAPADVLQKSMEENYGGLVEATLIRQWIANPVTAPGRLTSSPWPDRIDVNSVIMQQDGSFQVDGTLIEVTSAEQGTDKAAARRPITLHLVKSEEEWLIDQVTMGPYEAPAGIVYDNKEYGFRLSLPESWKGYSVVMAQWEGMSIPDDQGEKLVTTGPGISIRHPLWTKEAPRQDIPVYVFTLAQWKDMGQEKFHIGAAPIAPSELGRNGSYVFALPARYNYAYLKGFEEVDLILQRGSFSLMNKHTAATAWIS